MFTLQREVELATVELRSEDGAVHITWTTALEQDHFGFFVERIAEGSAAVERLTETTIRARGNGGEYAFVDDTGTPGATYRYQLVALDLRGETQVFAIGAVTVARVLPQRVALHQNHPNPFNPSTRIDFELAEAGRVIKGRPEPYPGSFLRGHSCVFLDLSVSSSRRR